MSKPKTYTVTATTETATSTNVTVKENVTEDQAARLREKFRAQAPLGSTTTITVK
jgi:hypothetical protein